jgi:hypothetical protein
MYKIRVFVPQPANDYGTFKTWNEAYEKKRELAKQNPTYKWIIYEVYESKEKKNNV